jgi:hypothetical protein
MLSIVDSIVSMNSTTVKKKTEGKPRLNQFPTDSYCRDMLVRLDAALLNSG